MECVRCGNKDPAFFYKGHKGYYCRKCIGFSRLLMQEDLMPLEYDVEKDVDSYSLSYELTDKQKQASKKCLDFLKDSDVLLHCVCGAGKTELSVESISSYLNRGLKVCYAIARREVVVELCDRFKQIFKQARVIGVYGGHHDITTADLIVCTTHQLFRYYKTFDLLILDEVDAFPLKGDDALMNIAINSCKGRIVFSTATVDDGLKRILKNRNVKTVELNVRPSGKPMIIPKLVYLPKYLCLFYLMPVLHSMTNQCIIFVSSREECKYLYRFCKLFLSCTYVYSDLGERNENIRDFKNKKFKYIFATSVLERGITIKDVNVMILDFGKVFDESNLIQMLGRVGRSISNPYGKAYIIANHFDKNINETIKYLKYANEFV